MYGAGGYGHPSWAFWQAFGLLLTVLFCLVFTMWFADFYFDSPKDDVDTSIMMQVIVDNPDGSISSAMVPKFTSAKQADTINGRLKEDSWAWLYIFLVIIVVSYVGAKGL